MTKPVGIPIINLRVELARRGWSGAELARQTGINQSSISRIMCLKEKPYGRAERIAKAIEWPGDPKELFEEVKA